ncbi:hypothetical protein SCOR_32990 [Sulfidibacter corallicola]|uniref:Uncharacterized protein n=1 Tax=Sulfidibacter corallicola TaxID=2818388 RepID=A0A8A4TKI0_SULCO|nr:hypothetical protein [Sulfidibacter corallicola]QTD49642.1 hypothetical protein J3U87_29010 [Sulfidibacter corallicola]
MPFKKPGKFSPRAQNDMATMTKNEEPPKPKSRTRHGNAGNNHNLKHGLFVNAVLNDEEKGMFDALVDSLSSDFIFNKSADLIQVKMIALYWLKLNRAITLDLPEHAERFDRMIRAHMRELKTTKLTREGDKPVEPTTTPAEWAADILAKAGTEAESEPVKPKRGRKPTKERASTPSISGTRRKPSSKMNQSQTLSETSRK